MDEKTRVKRQIEKDREILNHELLHGLNKEVLNISWKLDELIVHYMKIEAIESEDK